MCESLYGDAAEGTHPDHPEFGGVAAYVTGTSRNALAPQHHAVLNAANNIKTIPPRAPTAARRYENINCSGKWAQHLNGARQRRLGRAGALAASGLQAA